MSTVATTPQHTPYIPWYRRWDIPILLPAFILAAIMVWSVVQSIASANWAEGLDMLIRVAIPAVVVGLIFARLHWLSGWLAHLLSAILGVVWTIQSIRPLLTSQISEEMGAERAAWLSSWGDQATEVLIRAMTLGRLLQSGGRGEDTVLFVIALALLFWILAYMTSWLIFRLHWTWWAVILNAFTILINYTFTLPKPTTLFFMFLGAALLLVVHQHIVQQQQTWQSSLMDYPDFISWRFLSAATFFCIIIAIGTSFLPSEISNTQVARAWQIMSSPFTAAREGWEVAFSTINAPPGTTGGGFSTQSVRVGGGRALGDAEVMRVYTDEYEYWRANAFDQYTGRGWGSTVGERARALVGAPTIAQARSPLDIGIPALSSEVAGRILVTHTIELTQQRGDNLLMVGGQFVSAGIPVMVEHGYIDDGEGIEPNYLETTSVLSQLPLQTTQGYTVTALVSTVDQQSLRDAGINYPDWLRNHYLQLPDTITQRTRDEARRIVEEAGATNAYDQTIAIQVYLRRLTYDETRTVPPTNQDWVDYFLFERPIGYCDDFATAMVVMLRSLGIPARWVQGYAGGTLDPETGAYVVRQSVAHSWPEVYFPGYGWQRFEPTPASYTDIPTRPSVSGNEENNDTVLGVPGVPSDQLSRLELEEGDLGVESPDPAAFQRLLAERRREELQQQLLMYSLIMAAIIGVVVLIRVLLQRDLKGLSPTAAVYTRLSRLAGWTGLPHQSHHTPHEYANELARHLPEYRQSIHRIVDTYVNERYRPVDTQRTVALEREMRTLRWPMIRSFFSRLVQSTHSRRRKR
ncbi:MAG: transglutaminase domain-containing protein [Chloroflexi bacterium AL-W]|nr:transglutaminase domain-containing protein [Chloroflexi bacterium AL-N1]NOK69182.1 transglutaminase domain-containing protein [Chloroflexi bacterium AL-N10]NOK77165.1 transglutaminase domain-containing protein [Chloroflexi bacterium AL-N5]NOK83810.1 transglutaminase domain-containing protein [Chloroflexi bacterium AL-W]NOK91020.1 transglutaminase domain-containing protein [Chloroflexi bacterium AL-N15]